MNDVPTPRQPDPNFAVIICLILTGVLYYFRLARWFYDKRTPHLVVGSCIVFIGAGQKQRQWNPVLIYQIMSFCPQFCPIRGAFPCFFPLLQVIALFEYPESAIPTWYPSAHHILSNSVSTSSWILRLSPNAGNTYAPNSHFHILSASSSTGNQFATHKIFRSSLAVYQALDDLVSFVSSSPVE